MNKKLSAALSVMIICLMTLPAIAPQVTAEGVPAPLGDVADTYSSSAYTWATVDDPSLVAQGDMDNDGNMDLIVASASNREISIHLTGEGVLTPGATIMLDHTPSGLDVFDIDRDGLDDIIVCYSDDDAIEWFVQDGGFTDGGSVANTNYGIASGILVEDLDNDTYADYILPKNQGVQCRIYISINFTGSPTNMDDIISTDVTSVNRIVGGDFDGNGLVDFAIADVLRNVSVYINQGVDLINPAEWSLDRVVDVDVPSDIGTIRLMDGDDFDSLYVVGRDTSYNLDVYRFDSTQMSWYAGFVIGDDPAYVSFLDMDGVGAYDPIITSPMQNITEAQIWPTSGPLGTPEWRFPNDEGVVMSTSMDVNQDGFEDLILISNGSISTYLRLAGIGNADDQLFVGTIWSNMRVGRGNGTLLFVTDGDSPWVNVFSEDGDLLWRAMTDGAPTDMIVIDLDQNGYDDVVALDSGNDTLSIFYADGSTSGEVNPSAVFNLLFSPQYLDSGNLSGDAMIDVAVAGGSNILIIENVGGNLDQDANISRSIFPGTISGIACGQMNLYEDGVDGQDDLLIINGSQVEIFYMDQSGIQYRYVIDGLASPPVQLSIGDVDHDSKDDLGILLLNGSIRFHIQLDWQYGIKKTEGQFLLDSPPLAWLSISDMDDDGLDEVLGTDALLNVIWVMETQGQAVLNTSQFTGGAGNLTAMVGDVDEDGRPDMLVASPGSSMVSVFLQANQAPVALAQAASTTPNEGSVVQLDASGSMDTLADVATLNYTWTAEGWTAYGKIVDYALTDSGNVTIELTVRDRDGLTDVDSIVLEVRDVLPSAEFDDDGPKMECETITFSHLPAVPGDVVSWTWDFGDGEMGYGVTSSHAYLEDGFYNVTLTVLDDEGNEANSSHIVEVTDAIVQAAFEHEGSLVEGSAIWFNDTSNSFPDAITNWTWDFGDGTFAYDRNVTHAFSVDGTYSVNLTIMDDDGRSDWVVKVLIIEDVGPSVSISIDDDTPVEDENVVLQDVGQSHDPIANYTWIIDDVEVGWEASLDWTFLEDGDHSITLLVTDSDGSEGRDDLAVNVTDLELQASFATDGGIEGEAITFVDLSSSLPDIITNWTWDFGDGNGSYGQAQSHVFAISGEYIVRLVILDDDGRMAWFNATVVVEDSVPDIHVSVSDYSPLEGDEVSFIDISTAYDGVASRQWYVDGNPMGAGVTMTHEFNVEGIHYVMLVVEDGDGSSANVSLEISVRDLEMFADFGFSSGVYEGGVVQFTDQSSSWPDAIINWTWDFGDGMASYSQNPSHIFDEDGHYPVNLTVVDTDGRTAYVEQMVTIHNLAPSASFTSSTPNAVEMTEIVFTDDTQSYDELIAWEWFIGAVRVSTEPSMSHTFMDNGSYLITLRVIDDDGNESSCTRTFVVLDSDPFIGSFSHDGGSSVSEGASVVFTVTASSVDGIMGYQWDFGDGTNTSTLLGVVEHSYTHRGEYTVMVWVEDSDSGSEGVLYLNVVNIGPVASFTYQVRSGGLVIFDASASSDTPGDALTLSWNFYDGNGDQGPFETRFMEHQYDGDGTYSVTLTVIDDDGRTDTCTLQVVVDLTSPVISNMTVVEGGTVGSPTIIKAQVDDEFDVASVTLHYILNGTEHTTPMTQDADGRFSGQVPSVDAEQDIIYWVEAIDESGNDVMSGEMELQIREAGLDPLIIGLVAVILLLIVTLVFILTMGKVEEVFIIYNDGRLMAHESNRLKPGMDNDIMSSMLIAIQDFVTDSFVDDEDTSLNRLRFGKKEVLIERGDHIFMAVVLEGKPPKSLGDRIQRTIREMEHEFPLEAWDGDMERVRGMRERSRHLFRLASIKRS